MLQTLPKLPARAARIFGKVCYNKFANLQIIRIFAPKLHK
ncbi:hypothetical protein HMPREF9073_00256 [Capnocytophaga sp. oral taxon 326 str. F0382]|nr:hypothetical protein HMPREF9073_00256 [Capnocytophaga sp. oral taxon 326 str. F0382]